MFKKQFFVSDNTGNKIPRKKDKKPSFRQMEKS